jgi:hypothetical protein
MLVYAIANGSKNLPKTLPWFSRFGTRTSPRHRLSMVVLGSMTTGAPPALEQVYLERAHRPRNIRPNKAHNKDDPPIISSDVAEKG